ncbi:hypothetical protein HDU93_000634 [Gonapodya sp. JEL0774]|nr:hypothetical protein HDU93_000634 [Gonapodya sp. JEL0774]
MSSQQQQSRLYGMPDSAYSALNSMYADELATKIKGLENEMDSAVPPTQPFVIRLDGVAFSTFTKDLPRPFDRRLSNAMVATSVDLVEKFNASCGYTQSDEISLVFPAVMGDLSLCTVLRGPDVKGELASETPKATTVFADESQQAAERSGLSTNNRKRQGEGDGGIDSVGDGGNVKEAPPLKKPKMERREVQRPHIYSGRVQKLASVMAGYASSRFNFHLQRCFKGAPILEDLPPELQKVELLDRAAPPLPRLVVERMNAHVAYFDARVIPCSTNSQLMECIFWRSNFDGFRNAIQQIARAEVMRTLDQSSRGAQKRLESRGTRDLLRILAEDFKFEVFGANSLIPKRFLYGTWIKKEQYEVTGFVNPKTGKPVETPVIRNRMRVGSFNWADWSEEERTDFTLSKHWPKWGGREPPMDTLEASQEVCVSNVKRVN